MKKVKDFLIKHFWLLLIALSLPAIWKLLQPGYFGVSDDMHIAWLYEMDQVIKAGKFPPRFVPDLSYGFGYPLFNFVFPLPFYIGEIFHLFGFTLVGSIKAVFGLSMVLSMLGMYKLLRRFVGERLSLLGSIIYIYAPYRATDIFVRGAVGEAFSFVFLPLIILSFVSLIDFKKKEINWKWVGIGSLSIAGLVLSHNITAYMFIFASLLLLVFGFLYSSRRKTLFINSVLTLFFGLLNSAFFWVPAIIDSKLMKYDAVFNYIDHFPTIRQLITPYFGYGASVPGPYDGMSFFIGMGQLIVIVLGLGLFFYNFKKLSIQKRVILSWSFVILMGSIFMMNYRSTIVWKYVPLIAYFQFPWRFLSLVIFSSSLFVVGLEQLKFEKYISFGLIALSVFLGFSYFKPSEYLGRFDDYYLNRYIPRPVASEEYKKTSEEYLRLPLTTNKRPDKVYSDLYGDRFIVKDLVRISPLNIKSSILVLDEDAIVNYNKYDFPGWIVRLNGKDVKHFAGEPFGQVSFKAPIGKQEVIISFRETMRNKILDFISLVCIVLVSILSIKISRIK